MVRLFQPVPDPAPEKLTIEGSAFHYLTRVLRLGGGDALEVFDGKGRSFDARVEALGDGRATLALGASRRSPAPRHVTLVQALPKGDRMEWVLQKATELGASAFAPVRTARTVVKLEGKRAEERRARWQRIAEEAARQCGRADVPDVLPIRGLAEAVRGLPPGTRVIVLDEEEKALGLGAALAELTDLTTPIALVIGPEGGLERVEVEALGATRVSLGSRVLRTDTAPIAALAVIQHLDGTLG